VDQLLQRQKQWVKQSAPPFENAFKVRTDWLDEKHHDDNKEASLNGIRVHVKFVTANTTATGRPAPTPPIVPQPKGLLLL
jgi:hypothetical protein